ASADGRAHREGHEGRPRALHRGRRLRLHPQAGGRRTPSLRHPRMSLSIVRNAPKGTAARVEHAEDVEVRLLLEGIFQYYGHDFRHYDPGIVRDRILRRVKGEGVGSIS